MPLKSRQLVPPGGKGYWIFFQASTGKHFSTPTFSELVTEIINHRLANPRFAMTWTTVREEVENEVDENTCLRLAGDLNWCTGKAPPNFTSEPLQSRQQVRNQKGESVAAVADIAAGAITLSKWLGEGAKPVARELAEERAKICVECPHNSKGDWTRFFTVPAANGIQRAVNAARTQKIETSQDENLNVCEICSCPLKIKVHLEVNEILKNTPKDIFENFPAWCWIKKESEPKQ